MDPVVTLIQHTHGLRAELAVMVGRGIMLSSEVYFIPQLMQWVGNILLVVRWRESKVATAFVLPQRASTAANHIFPVNTAATLSVH